MAAKQRALITFLQKECANWDGHYQVCLLKHKTEPETDRPCCVLAGKRCGYFERCVLGRPDYNFKLPGYDYARLFAQYAAQTGAGTVKVKQRRCECGEPLQRRQRFCEACRRKRAKEANRNRQQKYRKTAV